MLYYYLLKFPGTWCWPGRSLQKAMSPACLCPTSSHPDKIARTNPTRLIVIGWNTISARQIWWCCLLVAAGRGEGSPHPKEAKSCLLVSYVHSSSSQETNSLVYCFYSSTSMVMFNYSLTLCSCRDVQQVQYPGRQHHP